MSADFGRLSPMLKGGWRRRVIALIFGSMSAAALPPFYVIPSVWIGLAGLTVLNMSARGIRSAALEGWAFGLGWFGFGLYWVGHAFLVDAERYAFLMPFAVVGLAGVCAMFVAAQSAFVAYTHQRLRLHEFYVPVFFAASWAIAEWLRGWMFTGFPWNPLASIWAVRLEFLQSISFLGASGLGFVTALMFSSLAVLVIGGWRTKKGLAAAFVVPLLIIASMWVGGTTRLSDATMTTHDGVLLRLIQPAIPQSDKWQPELRQGHVIKQMALSRRSSGPAGPPTHVIWAETNVPFLIEPDSPLLAALAAAVPKDGQLIFGAPRRDADGKVFNSLMSVDSDGKLGITYDKFHLVPFGEYVPLRGLLPFERLTAGRGDFSSGTGPRTLRIDGLPPFSAIICYEVIFPGRVLDPDDRPEWIVNITNDAWFGPSTGPRQHLVQAQLRAIEEGLPLVRVANNGISAVIDAHGRIRNSLDLNEQGLVDAPLPVALTATIYAQYGGILAFLMVLLAFSGGLLARSRQSEEN